MQSLTGKTIGIYKDDTAWHVDDLIRGLKKGVERDMLRMGEKLYEVLLFKHHRTLGYSTFPAYCASIDISRTAGYRLAQIHEVFTLHECPPAGLIDAGQTKLALLAHHVEEGRIEYGEHLEGWLWAAGELSRSDLRKELKEAFGDDAVPPLPVDYRAYSRMYHRAYRQLREWIKRKGEYDDFKHYNRNRRERAREQDGDVGTEC